MKREILSRKKEYTDVYKASKMLDKNKIKISRSKEFANVSLKCYDKNVKYDKYVNTFSFLLLV